MIRRIPILPTLVVLAAVATMISLGIWQLGRAEWKEALLAQYARAGDLSAAEWPVSDSEAEQALYRRSTVLCERVLGLDAVAGRNAAGQMGWARTARCKIDGAGDADIVLGWSAEPNVSPQWSGGTVEGIIGPGREGEPRLIADPPLAGLEANAAPDPADLPNSHMSYAFQWFFFAATALVIYALALRSRWKKAA